MMLLRSIYFIACTVSLTVTALAAEPTRLMTYNIRYLNNGDGPDHWKNRVGTVAETVAKSDICGLQEVTKRQLDQLAEQLPGYEWYGVGRDDGQDAGEFTPVFWKKDIFEVLDKGTFWLGPDPTAVGKPAWGANLPRIASWVVLKAADQDVKYIIVNTHFDHQSGKARLESARLLRRKAEEMVKNDEAVRAVILTGDLNCLPESEPAMALVAESGDGMQFVDSLSISATPPSGPSGTWNGFQEISEGRRIDFVMIGEPQVEVLSHQTLDPKTPEGRFASDHLPVMIEFK